MLWVKSLTFLERVYRHNMNIIEERTIALAGVLQACEQVQSLARTGSADGEVIESSIQSILILDAVNTPAIYGGLEGVRSGLSLIANGIMSSPQADKVELLRYAMTLLHLQAQLYDDQSAFAKFGAAVEGLSSVASEEIIAGCSDIYQKFISDLRPQIIVQGEQEFLQQESIPPKIRAMLLAGIRSAVLWKQKGGGRFKLLWERTRMQNAAKLLSKGIMH